MMVRGTGSLQRTAHTCVGFCLRAVRHVFVDLARVVFDLVEMIRPTTDFFHLLFESVSEEFVFQTTA